MQPREAQALKRLIASHPLVESVTLTRDSCRTIPIVHRRPRSLGLRFSMDREYTNIGHYWFEITLKDKAQGINGTLDIYNQAPRSARGEWWAEVQAIERGTFGDGTQFGYASWDGEQATKLGRKYRKNRNNPLL